MEKEEIPHGSTLHASRRAKTRINWPLILVSIMATAVWLTVKHSKYDPFPSPEDFRGGQLSPLDDFDWETLSPKPYLDYVPCLDGLQCARLELPMDPFNDTTRSNVVLAVVRQPALVPVTDPLYGGAVLLNPGGPGGGGVSFLQGRGRQIRDVIDSNATDGKHFDLISFDPRGVGSTRPVVRCFTSSSLDHSWSLRLAEEGWLGTSDAVLGRTWAMSIAQGHSCMLSGSSDYDVDFKKYVATSYVAADMLAIAEKHGQWRQEQALRLLKIQTVANLPDHLQHKPGKEKLQYWGFSYGTFLGNTFAAMFPDRVGRLVVDGVVDADDYAAALWYDNLVDTERAMDNFYFHCARVGYPACALADPSGNTSAAQVKNRTQSIIQGLYHHPLPVIGPNPEVITYSDVRGYIFGNLYKPVQGFPLVADFLAQIESGNGTEFAKHLLSDHAYECKKAPMPPSGPDATAAIACSDGQDQSHTSQKEFEEHIANLTKLSPTGAPYWATIRLRCIHYNVKAAYRFAGPWAGKTSHPLLMVGNTADPVTPLGAAKKMASQFEGAVALTQDSAGHCSLSAYSNCTAHYIRDYFQTGRLPPSNTTCAVDELPFDSRLNNSMSAMDVSPEMRQARERYARIAEAIHEASKAFLRGTAAGRRA